MSMQQGNTNVVMGKAAIALVAYHWITFTHIPGWSSTACMDHQHPVESYPAEVKSLWLLQMITQWIYSWRLPNSMFSEDRHVIAQGMQDLWNLLNCQQTYRFSDAYVSPFLVFTRAQKAQSKNTTFAYTGENCKIDKVQDKIFAWK